MMTKETAKQGIDLLFEMYDKDDPQGFINKNTKAIILEFIGGEPFLNINLINYICDYFFEQCLIKNHIWIHTLRISISTNGDLYFNEEVQRFIKKYNNYLNLSITVDGPKELHDSCRVRHNGEGTFNQAYAALKHYQKYYNSIPSTKVTIAPENLKELNNIIKFFLSENIYLINANTIYEHKWTPEEANTFYYELKQMADYVLSLNKQDEIYISLFDQTIGQPMRENENDNWCGGDMNMLAFDPNGDAYPCIRYMSSSLGNEVDPLPVGSVNGLFTTPKEKEIAKHLFSITRRSQSTDECFYCPIARGCAWCSAWNYQENGDVNIRSTNICLAHKARVLANAYYWNKYDKKNTPFKLNLPEKDALEIISKEEYEKLKELSK